MNILNLGAIPIGWTAVFPTKTEPGTVVRVR